MIEFIYFFRNIPKQTSKAGLDVVRLAADVGAFGLPPLSAVGADLFEFAGRCGKRGLGADNEVLPGIGVLLLFALPGGGQIALGFVTDATFFGNGSVVGKQKARHFRGGLFATPQTGINPLGCWRLAYPSGLAQLRKSLSDLL